MSSNLNISEQDPNLRTGFDKFTLPNGDEYEGNYCAHTVGLVWREGYGKYLTKDGQLYIGEWRDDKLVDNKEVLIKYPNGAEYRGPLFKDQYTGPATYVMDNTMSISCEFAANIPKNNVILIDVNGRVWSGAAEKEQAILYPENIFFLMIPAKRGIGDLKPRFMSKPVVQEEPPKEEPALSDREMETIIFAKSKVTGSNLDFENSRWYQRYKQFRAKRARIVERAKKCGSVCLSPSEVKWYEKYQKAKARFEKIPEEDETPDPAALDKSHKAASDHAIEEHRRLQKQEAALAKTIMYPTKDWDTFYKIENELMALKNKDNELSSTMELAPTPPASKA